MAHTDQIMHAFDQTHTIFHIEKPAVMRFMAQTLSANNP